MTPVEHDIRYSEMEDLQYLKEWFSEPRASEAFPFGFEEREDALNNWIGFSKYKASLTATMGERPVAIGTLFLMPYRKVAHQASFYLMVAPADRKQGIGTSVIRNLMHLAKSRFSLEALYVELFEPSLLPTILERLSFELFARQENYVHFANQQRARRIYGRFL